MHTYELLTDADELEARLKPILEANGSELPPRGCYAAAVEVENGEIIAYQMLQNAVFLEGLWAKDNSAHLRNLYNMAKTHAASIGAKRVMTMTRNDESGRRIGKLAEMLGFERMDWNIYRRKL